MAPKKNPLKLNKLQLKTLTLLQEIATLPDMATPDGESGEVVIEGLPHAHGNHFHVGSYTVMSADATGLSSEAVWVALQRKGVVRRDAAGRFLLTAEGVAYETGLRESILHGSDH